MREGMRGSCVHKHSHYNTHNTISLLAVIIVILSFFTLCTYSRPAERPFGINAKKDFLFDKNFTFSVSILVDIGLVGFKEIPNLLFESGSFQHQLEGYNNVYKPHCLETGEPIPTYQYVLRYRVQNLPVIPIQDIENIIYQEIKSKIRSNAKVTNKIIILPTYLLEHKLESICVPLFALNSTYSIERGAVVVFAPSLKRILDKFSQAGEAVPDIAGYQWKYQGGAPSNTFIGKHKLVYIDLGASKSFLGPISQDEGTLGPFSVPAIPTLTNPTRDIIFESRLANVVMSAITNVFIGDINFIPQAESYDKILVPIITLSNHNQSVYYDFNTVGKQIDDMFPNSTTLHFIRGFHNLHEHRHVSIALSKSIRTKTHYEYEDGKFKLVGKQYIDSKTLIYELKHSVDALTKGLLSNQDELNRIFFPKDSRVNAQGLQILPVYIFSLHDMGEILFEDYSVVQASHDTILVLHSSQNARIEVPYFIGNKDITLNITDSTRHIIAGVAMSQGVVPPTLGFSSVHKRLVSNYLWATGYHPFGHYSSVAALSPIHKDAILRNIVLGRISKALNYIHEALGIIEEFATTYMHGKLSTNGDYLNIIEEFYEGDEIENPLLYTGAVDQLRNNLNFMKEQFIAVSDKIRFFNHEEAYLLSKSFILSAQNFLTYTQNEIHDAKIQLACCNIKHIPSVNIAYYGAISTFLAGCAVLTTLVFLAGYIIYRRNSPKPKKDSHLKQSILLQ